MAQIFVMASGAALILAGLVLVVLQVWQSRGTRDPMNRSLQVGPSGLTLTTTYPGLILIALGVALEIVGFLK
jgi:hypothetical protein